MRMIDDCKALMDYIWSGKMIRLGGVVGNKRRTMTDPYGASEYSETWGT